MRMLQEKVVELGGVRGDVLAAHVQVGSAAGEGAAFDGDQSGRRDAVKQVAGSLTAGGVVSDGEVYCFSIAGGQIGQQGRRVGITDVHHPVAQGCQRPPQSQRSRWAVGFGRGGALDVEAGGNQHRSRVLQQKPRRRLAEVDRKILPQSRNAPPVLRQNDIL